MIKERIDDETSGQSVSSSISSAFPVCLHQRRRRFRAARCIFWCKADVINGFPGLLAPKPPPISGGAAHFLGARPT